MQKPNNLYPNNISVDISNGVDFTWEAQGSPQTDFQLKIYDNDDQSLLHDSGKITTSDESYFFDNTTAIDGDIWTTTTNGNTGLGQVDSILYLDNGVVLVSKIRGQLLRSTDYGDTWQDKGNYSVGGNFLLHLANNDNVVIMIANNGAPDNLGFFYRSVDSGQTWTSLGTQGINIKYTMQNSLKYCGNNTFIYITPSSLVVSSLDNGITWNVVGSVLSGKCTESIGDGVVVAGNSTGYIYKTINYGSFWDNKGLITNGSSINVLKKITESIILGGTSESSQPIIYSSDAGDTWTKINIPSVSEVSSITYASNGIVFFSGYDSSLNHVIYKSIDYGSTWSLISDDILPTSLFTSPILYTEKNLLIGTFTSIYYSNNYDIYKSEIIPSINNGEELNWQVTTYSGLESKDSIYSFFKTSSSPTPLFTSPDFSSPTPVVLTTQSYAFIGSYTQAESVALKRYKIILYDYYNVELYNTNWVYDFNINQTIDGLNNDSNYYIELIVESQNGITSTTGKNAFSVAFSPPDLFADLVISENNCNGNIDVSWGNIFRNLGVLNGTGTYTTGLYDNAIQLGNNSFILYETEFDQENFTIYSIVKPRTNFNGTILTIDTDIVLGYDFLNSYFYWNDGTLSISSTATFSNSYWYIIAVCVGGEATNPIRVVISQINGSIITQVATISADTIGLF